ncbi:MAG: ATP-binding protein [Phycisphaerales bacterium]|nr:ATP-binding protein [Phycisphaerales bacterium]
MNTPIKSKKLLTLFACLYEQSKNGKLQNLEFVELEAVAEMLVLDKESALLLSIICYAQIIEEPLSLKGISSYLGLSLPEFLPYKELIDDLVTLKIIKRNVYLTESGKSLRCYQIEAGIMDNLLHNQSNPLSIKTKVEEDDYDTKKNAQEKEEAKEIIKEASSGSISLLRKNRIVFSLAKSLFAEDASFQNPIIQIKDLSDYLSVTPRQAFIVSVVFGLSIAKAKRRSNRVDFSDFCDYLNMSPFVLLEWQPDFEDLMKRGFLHNDDGRLKKKSLIYMELEVDMQVVRAFTNNEAQCPQLIIITPPTIFSVFDDFQELVGDNSSNSVMKEGVILDFLESNKEFPLINAVLDLKLENEDTILLLYIMNKLIDGDDKVSYRGYLRHMYDKSGIRMKKISMMHQGNNELLTLDMIEKVMNDMLYDVELMLTDKSVNILKDSGIDITTCSSGGKNKNQIHHADIAKKPLFFNEQEAKQIENIQSALQEDKFKDLQDCLKQKNLVTGITALFYGAPGTGKTESVYQIAKATQRNIMKIDISQTNSMWFGESEKIIKKIFTDYETYRKRSELCPILFFNEGDGILSKRNEQNVRSNSAATENRMQNILLEELERFSGIFFATTNLANNLDRAFERRLLFKVEFHKPGLEQKKSIWRNKLPLLDTMAIDVLAQQYDFSGGQIDNIARKNHLIEIIEGRTPNLEELLAFCDQERLHYTQRKEIGFLSC